MYQLEFDRQSAIYRDELEGVQATVPKEEAVGLLVPEYQRDEHCRTAGMDILDTPDFGPSLRDLCHQKKAKSASILVSDATRNVPTRAILPYVIDTLYEAGIPYQEMVLVVALGVHRPATEKEISHMIEALKPEQKAVIPVLNHDAYDADGLMTIGTTGGGQPIKVNARAFSCDLHISIGKVEPHEFAGFSGGRKSVLPGIAAAESILDNHSPAHLMSPYAVPGVLDNNPIHLEMLEFSKAYRIDFSIQFILDEKSDVFSVMTGEHPKAHEKAVSVLRKQIGVTLPPFDIVVATPGVPYSIDFYQTVKAVIALTPCLTGDSIVVLYAACPEGINSPDMLAAFQSGVTIEEVLQKTEASYTIQKDHVLLLGKILGKGVRIVVYAPNIAKEDIEAMLMTPCTSLQEGIDLARSMSGKETPRILFYPQAQKYLIDS